MPDPFDRFTEEARQVVFESVTAARNYKHAEIDPEHLLLALIGRREYHSMRVLTQLGITANQVEGAINALLTPGSEYIPREIGLSQRSKGVVEFSVDEAMRLHQEHIGTEHVLFGISREGEGIAAGVLESLGANIVALRRSFEFWRMETEQANLPVLNLNREYPQLLQFAAGTDPDEAVEAILTAAGKQDLWQKLKRHPDSDYLIFTLALVFAQSIASRRPSRDPIGPPSRKIKQ